MLGHFVSYMLMLGHAGERAPRRDSRYRMFHVKPYEASEAETNKFVSISESIKVGLYRRYSPNMSGNITSIPLRCTSLWRVCRGGQMVLVPGV